jgi:phytochrome B
MKEKERLEKQLIYIKEESRKPLEGIKFTRQLLAETELSEVQQELLATNVCCERQLRKILEDDLNDIEDG